MYRVTVVYAGITYNNFNKTVREAMRSAGWTLDPISNPEGVGYAASIKGASGTIELEDDSTGDNGVIVFVLQAS